MVWEYYIKSRDARAYQQMLQGFLYHPPHITVKEDHGETEELYLVHHFEGKPLVQEFIANTMMGIEYLWGKPVKLETSEVVPQAKQPDAPAGRSPVSPKESMDEPQVAWHRVVYTMQDRKLSKSEV